MSKVAITSKVELRGGVIQIVPMEKSAKKGEGSRGGHITGHTKSGKPVYRSKSAAEFKAHTEGWTTQDHDDAWAAHREEAKSHGAKMGRLAHESEHGIAHAIHTDLSAAHSAAADGRRPDEWLKDVPKNSKALASADKRSRATAKEAKPNRVAEMNTKRETDVRRANESSVRAENYSKIAEKSKKSDAHWNAKTFHETAAVAHFLLGHHEQAEKHRQAGHAHHVAWLKADD